MQSYKHVLLVTDLREDCDAVFECAKYMINVNDEGHLSVLHIVEEAGLITCCEVLPIVPIVNESELIFRARERLQALLDKHDLVAQVYIETALSIRSGILEYAKKISPDLIVIGRHKRSGLATLFGSTADGILPSIRCDVLVVKLYEPD